MTDVRDADDEENFIEINGELVEKNGENGVDHAHEQVEDVQIKNQFINTDDKVDIKVEIEYVGEELQLDENDPNYTHFAKIFDTFKVFF